VRYERGINRSLMASYLEGNGHTTSAHKVVMLPMSLASGVLKKGRSRIKGSHVQVGTPKQKTELTCQTGG